MAKHDIHDFFNSYKTNDRRVNYNGSSSIDEDEEKRNKRNITDFMRDYSQVGYGLGPHYANRDTDKGNKAYQNYVKSRRDAMHPEDQPTYDENGFQTQNIPENAQPNPLTDNLLDSHLNQIYDDNKRNLSFRGYESSYNALDKYNEYAKQMHEANQANDAIGRAMRKDTQEETTKRKNMTSEERLADYEKRLNPYADMTESQANAVKAQSKTDKFANTFNGIYDWVNGQYVTDRVSGMVDDDTAEKLGKGMDVLRWVTNPILRGAAEYIKANVDTEEENKTDWMDSSQRAAYEKYINTEPLSDKEVSDYLNIQYEQMDDDTKNAFEKMQLGYLNRWNKVNNIVNVGDFNVPDGETSKLIKDGQTELAELGYSDEEIKKYTDMAQRMGNKSAYQLAYSDPFISENDPERARKIAQGWIEGRIYNMGLGVNTNSVSVLSNLEDDTMNLGRDKYSLWAMGRNYTDWQQESVMNELSKQNGFDQTKFGNILNNLTKQTIGQNAYNLTGMGVDSALNMAIAGVASKAVGVAGAGNYAEELANMGMDIPKTVENAAKVEQFIQNISIVPYAASGYEEGYWNAIDSGLSEEEAQLRGIVGGFAEYVTERVSLDAVWDVYTGKAKKNIIAQWIMPNIIEGSEEVNSDIINDAADYIFSNMFEHDSEFQQAMNDYHNKHYSDDGDAIKTVFKDKLESYLSDFLGGFVTGLPRSAVAVGGQVIDSYNFNQELKSVAQENFGENSEYGKNYAQLTADILEEGKDKEQVQKIADKVNKGKKLTAQDRYTIYQNSTQGELNEYADEILSGELTTMTEDKAREQIAKGINEGNIEAIEKTYIDMKKSINQDVAENADKILADYESMAVGHQIDVDTFRSISENSDTAISPQKAKEHMLWAANANVPFEEVVNNNKLLFEGFSEKQLRRIYDVGVEERQREDKKVMEQRKLLDAAIEKYAPKDIVPGKIVNLEEARKAGASKELITVSDILANVVGFDVKIKSSLDSLNGAVQNASIDFDNKVITVSMSGQAAAVFHEAVGEFTERYNKSGHDALMTDFMGLMSSEFGSKFTNLTKNYQATYSMAQQSYETLSDTMREMTNDMMPVVLSTEKGAKAFAEYIAKNYKGEEANAKMNALQKFIKKIADAIKKILKIDNLNSMQKRMLENRYEEISNLADKVIEVFDKARENYSRVQVSDGTSLLQSEETHEEVAEETNEEMAEETNEDENVVTEEPAEAYDDWIRERFGKDSNKVVSSNYSDEIDDNTIKQMVAEQTELNKKFSLESMFEAINLTIDKKNGLIVAVNDITGERINKITPEYIRNTQFGAVIQAAVTNKNIDQKDANKQIKFMSDLFNQILDTQDADLIWAINSTIGFQPVTEGFKHNSKQGIFAGLTGNSDPQYSTTIDFTTICLKTQAVIDAMSQTMLKLGRGIDRQEVIDIVYRNTHKAGEPVPCPVCYVFSRWVGLGGLLDTINTLQNRYSDVDNSVIEKRLSDLDKKIEKRARELDSSKDEKKQKKAVEKATSQIKKQLHAEFEELDAIKYDDEINKTSNLSKKQFARWTELRDFEDMLNERTWFVDVRLNPEYEKKGHVPQNILFDINKGKAFAEQYPLTWKFRTTKGSGMGKATTPYADLRLGQYVRGVGQKSSISDHNLGNLFLDPFLYDKDGNRVHGGKLSQEANDLIAKAVENQRRQNLYNGQRLQSTSDFRYEYGLDYLMAFFEMQAIGAKGQMYTKVPEAVHFLASMGIEINCSIMPEGMGYVADKDGNPVLDDKGNIQLIFSGITGMHPDDAFNLSSQFNNVQPIIVGINNTHIRACLADNRITFLIPYHASGNTEDRYKSMMDTVGEAVAYRDDYSPYQNDVAYKDRTDAQKAAWKLRLDILGGAFTAKTDKKGNDISHKLNADEKKILANNKYLRDLYDRFYKEGVDPDCYGVTISGDMAKMIMPYEYWDKSLTIDQADINSQRFFDYCEKMGIHPRFTGWTSSGQYNPEYDFSQTPGYWKMLPDRSMYNLDGTYHEQKSVDVTKMRADYLDKTVTDKEVIKPSVVNQTEKIDRISQQSVLDITAKDKGYTVKAYHGSPITDIQSFDLSKAGQNTGAYNDKAIWFSSSEQFARDFSYERKPGSSSFTYKRGKQGKVYPMYLNLGNNLDLRNLSDSQRKMISKMTGESIEWLNKMLANRNHQLIKSQLDFDALKAKGYDSITCLVNSKSSDVEYGIFDNKRAKSAELDTGVPLANRFDSKSDNINYSLSVDSTGKELSDDQKEYFKNSKVVDAQGRLLRMYHGTEAGRFTVFDPELADDGISMFFSSRLDVAKGYSGTRDIIDPYFKENLTLDYMRKGVHRYGYGDIKEDNGHYKILEYRYSDDPNPRTEFETDSFDELKDYYIEMYEENVRGTNYEVYLNIVNPLVVDAKGNIWNELPSLDGSDNYATTRDYARYAKENGYDGVIIKNLYDTAVYASRNEDVPSDVVIAFESNQIKSVYNENPTENEDIRYSFLVDAKEKEIISKESKQLKNEIDNWDDKNASIHFTVGETSKILKKLGMDDNTIELDSSKLIKIFNKHPEMKKLIYRLPEILHDPIIVMSSLTDAKSVVVVGDVLDDGNNPVLAILLQNPTNKRGIQLSVTKIKSSYSKDNAQSMINNSDIYYLCPDNNITTRFKMLTGLQLPVVHSSNGYIKSVSNLNTNVNSSVKSGNNIKKSLSVSEDSTGRTLTDEQMQFFKNAQAVDAQGRLLRLYHGTPEKFSVFKGNEWVQEIGGTTLIKGYFSTNEEYAAIYGDTSPYYLNVKNILDFSEYDGPYTLDGYKSWLESKGVKNVKFDSSIPIDSIKGGDYVDENGNPYKTYIPFELIDNTGNYWHGDGNLTEAIKNAGYDAVKWIEGYEDDDIAIMPFAENAIKRADNLNPTDNPDINYSFNIDDELDISSSDLDRWISELSGIPESWGDDEVTKTKRKVAQRHLTRLAMGEEFQAVDGKRLGYTDERIARLFSAYASSNPVYSQAYVTYMSPADFLLLTANSSEGTKTFDKIASESRPLDMEKMSDESQPIYLIADLKEDGSRKDVIVGHEGRHRMYALAQAGFTQVPVIVEDLNNKYTKKPISSVKVYPQSWYGMQKYSTYNKVELTDLVPFSREYEQEINDKFGAGTKADARFALQVDSVFDEVFDTDSSDGILKAGMEALKSVEFNEKAVEKIARKLTREIGSSYDQNQFEDKLKKVFAYINTNDLSYEDLLEIVSDVALPVVQQAQEKDGQETYDQFIKDIGSTPIRLTEQQEAEVEYVFGSYNEFRKQMMPLRISRKGTVDLDQMWSEIVDKYGYALEEDISPAAEPEALYDLLQALKPTMKNSYGGYEEDVAKDFAMRIIQEYMEYQSNANTQKSREKVKQLREALAKSKANYDEWRQRKETQYKEKYEKAKAKLEERESVRAAKISDIRADERAKVMAKNKETLSRRQQRAEQYQIKKRITQNANKMLKWAENPTEDNHIPSDMVPSVIKFLNAMDFVKPEITYHTKGEYKGMYTANVFEGMVYNPDGTKEFRFSKISGATESEVLRKYDEALARGLGSKNAKTWASKMQDMADLLNRVNKSEDGDELNDFEALLDPTVAEEFQDMLNRNKDSVSLNNASYEDLKLLDDVVKQIMHAVKMQNKAFTMEHDMSELANMTIEKAKGKKLKSHREGYNKLMKTFLIDMLNPDTFFSTQGEAGNEIMKSLTGAFNKKTLDIKKAADFMEQKVLPKIKNIAEESGNKAKVYHFDLSQGSIDLTIAQVMSLYELNKRNQAVLHFRGGIKGDKVVIGGKELVQGRGFATSEDIKKITDVLTDEQKEVADMLQQYMAVECAKQGNEAALTMYDIVKFTDPNYFPITTDKSTIRTNNSNTAQESLNSIERSGFTKALIKDASNPILIRDIYDVFTEHVTNMAAYHGYAPAIKDCMRWLNYKEVNKESGGFRDYITVKDAINRNAGRNDNEGVNYIVKLIKDINGSEKNKEVRSPLDSLISTYKSAAIGANLRVVIQQPTAFARAKLLINEKYFAKALPSVFKASKEMQRIREISPIAWWKSQGYYETSVGKSIREILTGQGSLREKIIEKSMWLAGKADDVTWAYLYNTVEAEQRDLNKKALADGTMTEEEYRQAVNDRFDEVITQTQVVDATLQKTQWMRDSSTISKLRTAFMAEPSKSYNMLVKSMMNDYDEHGANLLKWKTARRALVVMAVTDILNSVAQALIDGLRYKDDDDEYLDTVVEYFKSNLLDNVNPFNRVPVFKDVAPQIWSALKGESSYGNDSSGQGFDMQSLSSLSDAIRTISQQIQGNYNKTGYAAYMTYAKAFSNMTGIPLYNASREITAVYNLFADAEHDLVKSLKTNPYSKIYAALDDNKSDKKVKELVDKAMNNNGVLKDIESGITSRYKSDYYELYSMEETDEADKIADKAAKGFRALGMSEEEIETEIESWKEKAVGYKGINDAIKTGEDIPGAVERVLEEKDADKVVDYILKNYNDTVEYDRDAQNESDIESNIREVFRNIDPELNYDEEFKRYNEEAEVDAKMDALKNQMYDDSNADYMSAANQLLDLGMEPKTLKSNTTSQWKDIYVKLAQDKNYEALNQLQTKIAKIRAACDKKSGMKLPVSYGTDYYKYEVDQIKKWLKE